jgi:hypothetical protein
LAAGEDNCPLGWECARDVRYYNQYQDASEPLKQYLSCVRSRLNRIQQREELEQTIGLISYITDEKIYQGTCHWEAGPMETGGCSHIYDTKHQRARVSAHYGGTSCRDFHKSYAIALDMSSDFQLAYVDEIIAAAQECSPEAYILDKTTHLHIDIGESYGCQVNDF